jgi:hypothetical protein
MDTNFLQYIDPKIFVLAIALYGIGLILKRSEVKDKLIPVILLVIGIVLAILWVLAMGMPFADGAALIMAIWTGIIQGILCACAAVFVSQLLIQAGKEN